MRLVLRRVTEVLLLLPSEVGRLEEVTIRHPTKHIASCEGSGIVLLLKKGSLAVLKVLRGILEVPLHWGLIGSTQSEHRPVTVCI